MAQVSGNKINTVQASKNLGTIIDTQVSGEKSNGTFAYRKLTNVAATQVSGQNKTTNYMGINAEGMDIRKAKKIDEKALATNHYDAKAALYKDIADRLNESTNAIATASEEVEVEEPEEPVNPEEE